MVSSRHEEKQQHPRSSRGQRMTPREPWRWCALLVGLLALAFAAFGPLGPLGRDGNLTAHVAQHLLLGDVAAPLLLLGLPASARARLCRALTRWHALSPLTSPAGALLIWAVVMTVWYLPAVHRAAAPFGITHVLDQVSFLVFGLLVWLAVFDVRPARPLKPAMLHGGLPWWARHLYAVGSRTLTLPAALIVWFAPGYGSADQVDAASLLIGFEMFLFVLALILAFVALAVHEGRRINDTSS